MRIGGIEIEWKRKVLDKTSRDPSLEMGEDGPEAEIISSEPNGLSVMLKKIIDPNLSDPKIYEDVKDWDFKAGIGELTSHAGATITFQYGTVVIENGMDLWADVMIMADFETLSEISSGGILTGLKAILTGKLKRKGSFRDLLKVQKVLSA